MGDVATQRQRALVLALLASMLLWNLPFGGLVMYPFKLLATWLHEMSHGLVMLVTGAGFDHLEIFRDSSGVAHGQNAVGSFARALIASAGYTGTALFGATFLVLGQTQRGARAVLAFLGVLMSLSAMLWVRNGFGMGAVLVGAVSCFGMAAFLPERWLVLGVNFVAAQSCINAVLDIRVLFRPELVINGKAVRASDAHNMANASFGNHWMWAGVWLVWSLGAFYIALRHVRIRAEGERSAASAGKAEAAPAEASSEA